MVHYRISLICVITIDDSSQGEKGNLSKKKSCLPMLKKVGEEILCLNPVLDFDLPQNKINSLSLNSPLFEKSC